MWCTIRYSFLVRVVADTDNVKDIKYNIVLYPPRLNLSFWVKMHHDLVCDILCLDLRSSISVPTIGRVSVRELWRPPDIARPRRTWNMTGAMRWTIPRIMPPVV